MQISARPNLVFIIPFSLSISVPKFNLGLGFSKLFTDFNLSIRRKFRPEMGRRESSKAAKLEEYSSSEEDKRKRKSPIEAASDDDDAEANEDLSLKIVQKSMQRAAKHDPQGDGVAEIIENMKEERSKKEKKKKRRKSKEVELPGEAVSIESNLIYLKVVY